MIVPVRAEFENFLSFQKLQTFDFQTTGIHFIYGINHDADIDHNDFTADSYNVGVGKSSLAMVLQYAFFGDIQRKVNKDQIINKQSGKNLYVGLEFEVTSTGDRYFVKRYRRHEEFKNKIFLLKWNGKEFADISGIDLTQTQEMINNIVILNIRTFEKSSLLTREDKTQFLELPILDRGSIFENIGQINKLQEYWLKAKKKYSKLEEDISLLNNDILKEETIIKRDKQHIEDTKEEEKRKVKLINSVIKKYEDELKEILSSEMKIKEVLANIITYKSLSAKLKEHKNKLRSQEKIQSMCEAEVKSLGLDVRDLGNDIINIDAKIKNRKPIICDKCGAVQNEEQYKKESEELVVSRDDLASKLSKKNNVFLDAQERLKEANNKYDELYKQHNKVSEKISETELPEFVKKAVDNEDEEAIANIKNLNTNIQTQKSILASIDSSDAIDKIEQEIDLHEVALTDLRNRKSEMIRKQKIFQFWYNVLDFKSENSLKQFIIGRIIPLFNNFVQQMIDVVYKGDLVIMFDSFFNETIMYQGEEWKYDELSTGEKMKLNFCINLAIFDLTRVNLDSCCVIFLDEIFTNVDTPTVIEFLDIIRERYAKSNGVYIISHEQKVKDNLKPDTVILIEKRNKISKIAEARV